MIKIMPLSPVEKRLAELPKGDGKWIGYDHVCGNLMKAAEKMASNRDSHLSEKHIETMAVLGTGHEETMKHHQMWLRTYGWID